MTLAPCVTPIEHFFEESILSPSFGSQSTTDEVLAGVDLSGKRVLVTGVSSGLSVETARALAARGAHVMGAARDPRSREMRAFVSP